MHKVVTIDELLSGKISREGTGIDGNADGSTGHLMEESALIYMRNKCQFVKEILVVHIAPEEMYYKAVDSRVDSAWLDEYRHVVTGEKIHRGMQRPAIAQALLEESIRNAFNGIAKSKIVRN